MNQIDGLVEMFIAEGAYDGEPTVKALTDRFGVLIEVTIPPSKNAMLSPDAAQNPSIRDQHIAKIKARSFKIRKQRPSLASAFLTG